MKNSTPVSIRHREPLQGVSELPDQSVQCCISRLPLWTGKGERNTGYYGTENSPEEYLDKIVRLYQEVFRVLRNEGSLWLMVGDSYWGPEVVQRSEKHPLIRQHLNYKNNDLIGFPWMTAFALRNRGWILRQDLIWHKTNPLEESGNDRCIRAHEYIFHFSKTDSYFYNQEAMKEDTPSEADTAQARAYKRRILGAEKSLEERDPKYVPMHSVWDERMNRLEEKRFQPIPDRIAMRCILASTKVNDLVLDPFMRTGNTAFIARTFHRACIGFEMDADYIKKALDLLDENQTPPL